MLWLNVSYFPQWPKSSVCPRLTRLCPVPSRHLRHPAPSTSCLCCCASDSAAVTCHFSRRCQPNDRQWQPKKNKLLADGALTLFCLCLCSDSWLIWAWGWRDRPVPGGAAQRSVPHLQPLGLSPWPQGHRGSQRHPLPLASLWGHQWKHQGEQLFTVYCPKISVKLLVLGWMMILVTSTEVSTGYTGVLSLFIENGLWRFIQMSLTDRGNDSSFPCHFLKWSIAVFGFEKSCTVNKHWPYTLKSQSLTSYIFQ